MIKSSNMRKGSLPKHQDDVGVESKVSTLSAVGCPLTVGSAFSYWGKSRLKL